MVLALYLPGIEVEGWYAAFMSALLLGLLNALLRPLLLLFTLPINILTLGLFTFVINGLLFWFVSSIVEGFSVSGFWSAFWAAFIMSVCNWLVSSLSDKK